MGKQSSLVETCQPRLASCSELYVLISTCHVVDCVLELGSLIFSFFRGGGGRGGARSSLVE